MPQPRFRSRSKRRIQKKMPGGRTKLVYSAKKPGLPRCSLCGEELKGIPRLSANQAKNAPKSRKRPQRPYGGFLCARCAREKIRIEARSK
jgi:large subunit ribosomal protein L34e